MPVFGLGLVVIGTSYMCLRFGHWLTLCTLNMHVLT